MYAQATIPTVGAVLKEAAWREVLSRLDSVYDRTQLGPLQKR